LIIYAMHAPLPTATHTIDFCLLNCLFRPVKTPVQRVVFVASVSTGFGKYRTVFRTILGAGVPNTWYMGPIFDHRWSHGHIFW
jgi:hypothetical protein